MAAISFRRLPLAAGLAFVFVCGLAQGASLPSGFSETRIATGLASPTAMAFSPDGRLFVAQQGGALRVIRDGALLASPFLTLSVNSSGERGLLGVAFDPNFATNRYIYVYYTTSTSPIHNRLSRFTASASNPDVVAAGSELPLVNLPALSSATNHNGGAIHFGGDGKIYVAVGDNANSSNAPLLTTTLGKVLRVNADGSIPADNPFLGQTTDINQLIWARGLRNPFTFAVDRSNGRIHVNDVGQDSWEEVNHAVAGANFGWPQTEGPNPPGVAGVTYPVHAYQNEGSSCAITGGAFYRPDTATFPEEYAGRYFFGDFCGGFIRMLSPPNYSASMGFATGIASLADIQVNTDGSLWYLARGNGGEVWRVQFSGAILPGITSNPVSSSVTAGQTATFSVTATGTAPLQYQWQRNGSDIPGANAPVYSLTTVAADNGATFRVRVSNAAGSVLSNSATLTVTSGTTTLFDDDLEIDRGWSLTPGINTTVYGTWQRGDPQPTSSEGVSLQPGSCDGGSVNCFVTELASGSAAWSRDVDGGLTSVQSPPITVPAGGTITLRFRYFFAHLGNATAVDLFRVRVVGDNGMPLTVFARGGASSNRAGVWSNGAANLSAYAGQTIRLRVEAYDGNPASLIEAGFDNVVVTRQ